MFKNGKPIKLVVAMGTACATLSACVTTRTIRPEELLEVTASSTIGPNFAVTEDGTTLTRGEAFDLLVTKWGEDTVSLEHPVDGRRRDANLEFKGASGPVLVVAEQDIERLEVEQPDILGTVLVVLGVQLAVGAAVGTVLGVWMGNALGGL